MVTPEFMVAQMHMIESGAEIHAGALKHYEEAGLWPSAWEQAQNK